MSEGDEVNIILLRVSIPDDVIIQRGDANDTLSAIVKESSVSD